jgi:hypothetical protein
MTEYIKCVNPVHGKVYLIQLYIIQFDGGLLKVCGIFQVLTDTMYLILTKWPGHIVLPMSVIPK